MFKLIKSVIFLMVISTSAWAQIESYLPLKRTHLPAVYKVVGASVTKLEKKKNAKLLGKILDVYIQHHQFDKSYYFYEILAPFYGKNKAMVNKALKKYPKKDRELATKNLEIALNEIINGNG